MRKTLLYSVLDQAALSAFNFVLALLLIRYWGDRPELFGTYSVVTAGALTLISVQNALILSHMTVLRPRMSSEQQETALLSMFWSANAVLTIAAMIVTFVITALASDGANPMLGLAAALYVGATLIREYTRNYHFSFFNAIAVLNLDALSLALSTLAIAVVWYTQPAVTLDALLIILGVSAFVASIPAILPHRARFRLSFDGDARGTYRTVWRDQSRWALLSVLSTEFQNRGYVFVVALAFGTTYVALLQAAALLFRPVQLLIHAWGRLARAIQSEHFAAMRYAEARKFTWLSLAAFAVIYVLFIVALAAAWPLIKANIFPSSFSDLEMTIVLWSIVTAISIVSGVFSLEMQCMIKFRELSYAAMAGACACACVLALSVIIGDFRGSVLAVIAGNVTVLAIIAWVVVSSDKDMAAQPDNVDAEHASVDVPFPPLSSANAVTGKGRS